MEAELAEALVPSWWWCGSIATLKSCYRDNVMEKARAKSSVLVKETESWIRMPNIQLFDRRQDGIYQELPSNAEPWRILFHGSVWYRTIGPLCFLLPRALFAAFDCNSSKSPIVASEERNPAASRHSDSV